MGIAHMSGKGVQIKSPAFQFYPTDYLGSQRVQMMTLEEEGAYCRLLWSCWQHGSIPSDPELAARLVGKGCSTTVARVVIPMFEVACGDGRVTHDRLELERAKQAKWKEKSSEGGKKSAEMRQNTKGGSTTVQPPYQPDGNIPIPSPSPIPLKEHVQRLHGIPSSVEEVIAFGKTLNPPKSEQDCRDFWAFYEGQARTNSCGDLFWVTSGGESASVITNWKAKLPSWGAKKYESNQRNNSHVDRNAGTANEGKSSQYAGVGKVIVPKV